jgi:hypothetical protein
MAGMMHSTPTPGVGGVRGCMTAINGGECGRLDVSITGPAGARESWAVSQCQLDCAHHFEQQPGLYGAYQQGDA